MILSNVVVSSVRQNRITVSVIITVVETEHYWLFVVFFLKFANKKNGVFNVFKKLFIRVHSVGKIMFDFNTARFEQSRTY